ncbi:iron(3+)-hydroxamate-binding protein YxeB [Paenibacillus radicis (ex Gao et al. 2016)]|uniref:Iron(3+)-hydroxamate-binding protein YxeB n=1 Tax=Paenibacillus radicis (ex Gao et al. 2016) TaxID=1737354 RepID=A0A917H267_9BACL|nr:iron(3+)-hydroxamate-binding protein YxeB [Paenibacillus radicis (ex Gao et al. 2016)]
MALKRYLLTISLLLLALTLAACGNTGKDSSSGSNAPKETEAPQTETAAPATRVYKHFYGETSIPVKPEKVVTLQYASQMISVGLKPIGAASHLLETTDPAFQGIEDIGPPDDINFEKILSLQPELIIAGDVEQDVYDKLSKIAPTVVIPWMDYDVFGHVQVIGDILNRQDEAAAWKTAFDEKLAAAKAKIADKVADGQTVAIYRVDPKEFYVYGVRNIGFTLYKALGLQPPAIVQKEIDKDPNLWGIPISLEMLPDYDADYVFVTLLDGEETSKRFETIQAGSLWKNLKAVKNNHVYKISMDTWLGYTPHDIEVQLNDAVNLLTQ